MSEWRECESRWDCDAAREERDALAAENASLSEALAAANREAFEASKRLAEAERRYEYFRRINPGQFHDLWSACLFNLRFDEEVDRRSTGNRNFCQHPSLKGINLPEGWQQADFQCLDCGRMVTFTRHTDNAPERSA